MISLYTFVAEGSSTLHLLQGLLAIVVTVLCAQILRLFRRSRNLPFPPGPRPSAIPFVGNIADMPSSHDWKTFYEWGQVYGTDCLGSRDQVAFMDTRVGPLLMVEVMGQKICIINSYEVANDLLNDRSLIYSDRPAMHMVNDLMDWKFNMGLQSYGPMYKKHRKVFQHGFNRRESNGYQHVQTRENTLLLEKLLTDPSKYDHHLRITTGAIIMMIGLGYQVVENDEFVRIAEAAQLAMVSAARPGAYLVDLLPILRYVPEWFPGASFQKVAREGRELSQELQTKPFAWALKQFDEGTALPSFFKDLMEHKKIASDDPEEAQHIIKCATAVMYATGADTILASTLTFILAMLHAPQVQKIAQEELDRVVGTDRLPTYANREELPYINAIVKESLRWELVIPLGVPHRAMEDDVSSGFSVCAFSLPEDYFLKTYNGYFIPKGTTIIANQWGISHDEQVFSDPFAFRPERFLDKESPLPDPSTIAFGWGRRICPGRFLAENSLWLHVATILACFNITPVVGDDGKPIIPPREYTSGMASRPLPFQCRIDPRNDAAVELIKQSVAALPESY
ncbi:Cytochrome P450 [Mycena sanguinolenta]|uniref:Cytochrome P450 n=1 Tax=Mycena sanguinolenta TaxID=230812 RepID=A0A8H7DC87_9AGAR|nr:Cytochrome P450 [Mycena sanguinolenta]